MNTLFIQTDKGRVSVAELKDDEGLAYAKTHGNRGIFCKYRCQRSNCQFLHRKEPVVGPNAAQPNPRQHNADHRQHDTYQNRQSNHQPNQHRPRAEDVHRRHANLPRRQGTSLTEQEGDVVEDYNNNEHPWGSDVYETLVKCLDLHLSERRVLRALAKALRICSRYYEGGPNEAQNVTLSSKLLDWFKRLPREALTNERNFENLEKLLQTLVNRISRTDFDRFVFEQIDIIRSVAPLGFVQGSDLWMTLSQWQAAAAQQRAVRRQHETTEYAQDDSPLLGVMCNEDDFSDTRDRRTIQRSLHGVVVDHPIPVAHGKRHLQEVYRTLREDYAASIRNAVKIVRKAVPRDLPRATTILPTAIYKRLREEDENRDVRLYLSICFVGMTPSRRDGLLFHFKMSMEQFAYRKMNWDKSLQNGNLLLLSANWFSATTPILSGVVHRQRPPKPAQGVAMRKTRVAFDGSFDMTFDHPRCAYMQLTESWQRGCSLMALESVQFFLPFERTLGVLQKDVSFSLSDDEAISSGKEREDIREARDFSCLLHKEKTIRTEEALSFSLSQALLEGKTHSTPPYVLQHPCLTFNDSVVLEPNALRSQRSADEQQHNSLNVLREGDWGRCAPWSAELEATLQTQKALHCLDPTQRDALRHIFTHNVAVVQGTPGTGKTFIGAKFVQILLSNFRALNCGPIVCVCFTNHAVDAFLHEVLRFEHPQHLVRLGASSNDPDMEALRVKSRSGALSIRLGAAQYEKIEEFKKMSEQLRHFAEMGAAMSTTNYQTLVSHLETMPLAGHCRNLRGLIDDLESETSLCRSVRNACVDEIDRLVGVVRMKLLRECEIHRGTDLYELARLLQKHQDNADRLQLHLKNAVANAAAVARDVWKFLCGDDDNADAPPDDLPSRVRDGLKSLRAELAEAEASMTEYKAIEKVSKVNQQKSIFKPLSQHRTLKAMAEAVDELQRLVKEFEEFARRLKIADDKLRAAETAAVKTKPLRHFAFLKEIVQLWHERNEEVTKLDDQYHTVPIEWWRNGGTARRQANSTQAVTSQVQRISALHADAAAGSVPPDSDDEMSSNTSREIDNDTDDDVEGIVEDGADQFTEESALSADKRLGELIAKDDREEAYATVRWMWKVFLKLDLQRIALEMAEMRTKLRDADSTDVARVLRQHRVIGATTTGCASQLDAIRKLRPKVVIVEEAAEVLEAHVLACLTESVEHLVLIGDHKQLQPKVKEELVLGQQKHLDVSLMERLVRIGADYVTLTTQRRMHPDISVFTKSYYKHPTHKNDKPVDVVDHPATRGRAVPRGVEDGKRVFFVTHDGTAPGAAEQEMPGLQSKYNTYEASVALNIANWLRRSNNNSDSVTILVPYTGQVKKAQELAKEKKIAYRSKSCLEGIRIVSVDGYQGEESDFIVLSLVRTEALGFLKRANRMCVALSRARCGMYIVGCRRLLEKSDGGNAVINEFMRLVNTSNPPMTADAFPAVCYVHPDQRMPLRSLTDAVAQCGKLCAMPLPKCKHFCSAICHGGSDQHAPCGEPCLRVGDACTPQRTCRHPCKRQCHQGCGRCEEPVVHCCDRCGHEVTIPCFQTATQKCTNPVTHECPVNSKHIIAAPCKTWRAGDAQRFCREGCESHMPCGHVCRSRCHADDADHSAAMKKCVEQKTLAHPVCKRHNVTVTCSATTIPPCGEVCGELVAACGHRCEAVCGQCRGPHVCQTGMTELSLPCGHTHTVRCADVVRFVCTEPCIFMLPCGHMCPGTCGVCNNSKYAYEHRPCSGACARINPCGHVCGGGCSARCPPCGAECDYSCGHGVSCGSLPNKQRHKCSDCPSRVCQERCTWTCPHQQCSKACHEACNRRVCHKRCRAKSTCRAHPGASCLGVCGEVCPSFCRDCFKEQGPTYEARQRFLTLDVFILQDEADAFLRGELTQDDPSFSGVSANDLKLVELPCCRAIVLSGDLDRHIDASCSSTEIVAPRCINPNCKRVLYPNAYKRKRTALTLRHNDIMSIHDRVKNARDVTQGKFAALIDDAQKLIVAAVITPAIDQADAAAFSECLEDYATYEHIPKPPDLPKVSSKKKTQQQQQTELYNQQLSAWNDDVNSFRELWETVSNWTRHYRPDGVGELCLSLYQRLVKAADASEDTQLESLQQALQALEVAMNFADHRRKHGSPGTAAQAAKYEAFLVDDLLRILVADRPLAESFPRALCIARLKFARYRVEVAKAAVAAHNGVVDRGLSGHPPHLRRVFDNVEYEDALTHLHTAARRAVQNDQLFVRGAGRPTYLPNPCLSTSCSAFQRFMNGVMSVAVESTADPKGIVASCRIAFHGTSPDAVAPICCRGFDVARRSGQAHGPGEYFGAVASISDGYAKGSMQMLVCALLSSHVTVQPGDILVVNNPVAMPKVAYVVPLGLVLYGFAGQQQSSFACTFPREHHDAASLMAELRWLEQRPLAATHLSIIDRLEERVRALEKSSGIDRPSRQLLQSLTAALGVTAGHWYKCSKGHLYVIGDCGGAMMTSKCPECGDTIGGGQYHLVGSNASAAAEVQAGASAAWPPR